jgi:integrase
LKKAAVATNQRYSGSHGLRHSFAQRRFRECLDNGIGEVAAKLRVAQEMGHSRSSITERYLQKTKP